MLIMFGVKIFHGLTTVLDPRPSDDDDEKVEAMR